MPSPFDPEMLALMSCVLCGLVMDDPAGCANMGKEKGTEKQCPPACLVCWKKGITEGGGQFKSPTCGIGVTHVSQVHILNHSKIMIDKTQVWCKHAASGCTCSGNYAFMESHLKQCTEECTSKKCTDAKKCTSKECKDKGNCAFFEL